MKKAKVKLVDGRVLLAALVIAAFSTVTMGHVASYCGGFEEPAWRWLGYVYAIGGDVAIAVAAFFTRWKTTRGEAWSTYFALVVVEAVFNSAYVAPWGRADWLAAWIYALFPTLVVALLSLLLRRASQLSEGKSAFDAIGAALLRRAGVDLAQEAEDEPQPSQQPPQEPQRVATIDDWREEAAKLDGKARTVDADFVEAAMTARGFALPVRRTVQAWAKETREAVAARDGVGRDV